LGLLYSLIFLELALVENGRHGQSEENVPFAAFGALGNLVYHVGP
jgi:hypothetical protein